MADLTESDREALLTVLMEEYGGTREDWTAMRSLNRVGKEVARIADQRAAEVLEETRDALYRGEGPDMFEDSDIVYGEWIGSRADRVRAALAQTEATR